MSQKHYDTSKMREAASSIRSQVNKTFKPSKDTIDATVSQMKTYFDDPVHTSYVAKYNKDAKPSIESVMNLMLQYADFLEKSAEAIDGVISKGKEALY